MQRMSTAVVDFHATQEAGYRRVLELTEQYREAPGTTIREIFDRMPREARTEFLEISDRLFPDRMLPL
ncbi:hypothetical protein [Streptosporangium saharense]|uniref:hypothetical protein n=1 Tax=Streptosporangium saharense TaxID=1706840 RepID=UPI00333253C7